MEIIEKIIFFTEVVGSVFFAFSGALTAIEKGLDIFGVIVLGVTTAVGGGILRDLLLGISPPSMFLDHTYVLTALVASVILFVVIYCRNEMLRKCEGEYFNIINLFDAIGLGVFAVTGVNTAISVGYKENAFLAIFIGVVTGIGGGMLRDVMAGKIPVVLRKRIYAVAALAGSLVYYELYTLHVGKIPAMFTGIAVTIIIRLLATRFKWSLPKVKIREE